MGHALVNYDKEKHRLLALSSDIKSQEVLFDEACTEWINMTLYASDRVMLAMKRFLETTNQITFNDTILAMRKDLYGIKTKLRTEDLKLVAQ